MNGLMTSEWGVEWLTGVAELRPVDGVQSEQLLFNAFLELAK